MAQRSLSDRVRAHLDDCELRLLDGLQKLDARSVAVYRKRMRAGI
jgi:hypothetical protein